MGQFKEGHKHGGKRDNAGRKSEGFRKKCAELADSPKFFTWARSVFDGEDVECRLDKEGRKVYFPVSSGDRIYLWEKLAAYAFGKPASETDLTPLIAPLQKMLDANQAKKLIEELNYPERQSKAANQKSIVGNGVAPIQVNGASASGL